MLHTICHHDIIAIVTLLYNTLHIALSQQDSALLSCVDLYTLAFSIWQSVRLFSLVVELLDGCERSQV
jgi:hypothetical protein